MLPALAYHFGILWEHIDTMPEGELDAYLEALDDIVKHQKAAQRG